MARKKLDLSDNNFRIKGYKIELILNDSDKKYLDRCGELSNYIYNWAIEQEYKQNSLYKQGLVSKSERFIREKEMREAYNKLKKDRTFLKSIDYESARISYRRAIFAFEMYFNKLCRKPKYKSKKKSKGCYSLGIRSDRINFDDHSVRLPGFPRGYRINTKFDNNPLINSKPFGVTVQKDIRGKYYLCLQVKEEKKLLKYYNDFNNTKKGEIIGIDINAVPNERYVLSNGMVIMGRNLDKLNKRISKLDRAIDQDKRRRKNLERTNPNKKIPISKNSQKRIDKYRKYRRKKADIIRNNINESTRKIINLHPSKIIMEGFNAKEMLSKHFIAKYAYDADFGLMREIMKKQCDNYNIPFELADKHYPSSKMCSNCGYIYSTFNSQKVFICPHCGKRINRHLNAAINLMHYSENWSSAS